MDVSLIPMFVANRTFNQKFQLTYEQTYVKANGTVNVANSQCRYILVDQPNGIKIASDSGIYNALGGEHEHTGNLEIQNFTNNDKLISFVKILFL